MTVTPVRRRSCSRQGSKGFGASPRACPVAMRSVRMLLSGRVLAWLKPEMGVFPFVVKIKTEGVKSGRAVILGTAPMIFCTGADRWTMCGFPFLVRTPGSSHRDRSSEISNHRIPAVSDARCSVRISAWKYGPHGHPIFSAARQASPISASVNTRSRDICLPSTRTVETGLDGTRPLPVPQANMA